MLVEIRKEEEGKDVTSLPFSYLILSEKHRLKKANVRRTECLVAPFITKNMHPHLDGSLCFIIAVAFKERPGGSHAFSSLSLIYGTGSARSSNTLGMQSVFHTEKNVVLGKNTFLHAKIREGF